MDQYKIGRFIAECRKEAGLTQMQLAEKLNITDRAVSKWENGKSMPDSSIMLDLCSELQISVNELLTGERIPMDNKNENNEKLLLEIIKQKEESDKRLLTAETILIIFSIAAILLSAVISAYLQMPDHLRLVIVLLGVAVAMPGLIFSIKIEQVAGYYECGHCHHKYVPTLRAIWMSMHMGRTRYMKCPECGKKSWQKKVISKD